MNTAAITGLRALSTDLFAPQSFETRTARGMAMCDGYRGTPGGDRLIGTGRNAGEVWAWDEISDVWVRYQ